MKTELLHQRLKRLRKEANLTAKEMALQVGVPQSTYVDWEHGRGMKVPPLQKISQVLAISVTELLTGQKPSLQTFVTELEKIELHLREIRAQLSSIL